MPSDEELTPLFVALYPHLEVIRQAIRDGRTEQEIHDIARSLMVFDTTEAK